MKLFSLASLRPSELFSFRGGVHPKSEKHLSADSPIEKLPMPKLLRVPLQQHIGAEAQPIVQRDDYVYKGQLIGAARGTMSANVHAPTSGRVIAVGHFAAPHPSGLPVATITIRPDGEDKWGPRLSRLRPEDATPDQLSARVMEAGIVGLGGAAFPAAVKLNLRNRFDLHTLIINSAECEPYLTCDDRLMRERAEETADGCWMMAKALGVTKVIIAVEANKPEAIAAMRRHLRRISPEAEVRTVPTRYPMGAAKQLVKAVTGVEVPARSLTAETGIIVHNVATAYAMHAAVRYGEPLISRIVTVSGRGVQTPKNLEVMIGTPVSDLFDYCGGFVGEPDRLLVGGPMMGQPLQSLRVPIVKGTGGILAMTADETAREETMPCIRCSSCVQACPCGLTPLEMHARIQTEDLSGAVSIGLLDCISCGSCSYVCPSNIALVQGFDYARGKLAAKQSQKHQQEETKRLAEARKAREEAVQEAKRQAMARRKAEQAAKKAAEAAAQAAASAAPAAPKEAAE